MSEALNVGDVESVLRLRDEFSDVAKKVIESVLPAMGTGLKAVGAAAALMGVAIIAGVATIGYLGSKGAQINDVTQSFYRLSGGVSQADQILQQMRAGVVGTINDFDLMTAANKLLATGALSSAADFGTLTQAARVLNKEGFGPIPEILDTVSGALETGRTRAVARMLVMSGAKDAEMDYAGALGVTKDALTESGKLEAKREMIMGALRQAVKDAGVEELDFAERIDQVKVSLQNLTNGIAVAIATSPVIKIAMDTIGKALDDAFGGSQVQVVKTITGYVNSFAIMLTYVAQAALVGAQMFNIAWSGVKTPILAVMTLIVGLISTLYNVATVAVEVAGKIGIVKPEQLAAVRDMGVGLRAMTVDLAKQTGEAALGVIGQNAFGKSIEATYDAVGTMRDKMREAGAEGAKNETIINALGKAHANTNSTIDQGAKLFDQFKSQLSDVSVKVDEATARHLSLDAIERLLGTDITKVGDEASIWGVKLSGNIGKVYDDLVKKALDRELLKIRDSIETTGAASAQFWPKFIDDLDKAAGTSINAVRDMQTSIAELERKTLAFTQDAMTQKLAAIDAEEAAALAKIAQGYIYTDEITDYFHKLELQKTKDFFAAMRGAADWQGPMEQAGIVSGQAWAEGFRDSIATNLGPAILGALQGGGNVMQSIGGVLGKDLATSVLGKAGSGGLLDTLTNNLGPTLGKAFGSVIPGLGTLLGAGLGALIDKVFAIGGPSKAELEGRKLEAAWESQMANMVSATGKVEAGTSQLSRAVVSLREQYLAAGIASADADRLANADIQAMLAAEKTGAAAVQAVIDTTKQRLQIMADVQAKVASGVDAVSAAWVKAGKYIPPEIQATIDKLLTMNGLTDAQRAKLQGLVDSSKPNYDELTQLADKYGISLGQLGPKFQQANIDSTSKQYYDAIMTLVDAGGDASGVLDGMSDEISKLVQDSLQFGAAIPDNMKPWIQRLADAGKLVDASGDKITDVTKLTFEATPIDESLKNLNDTLMLLVKTLNEDLPKAAQNAAALVPPNPFSKWFPPSFQAQSTPPAESQPPIYGPEVFVPSPRLAVVGTNGGEVVLHKDTYDALRGGGNSDAVVRQLVVMNAKLDLLPGAMHRGLRDAALIAGA